jgi:hypothetical protein
MECKLETFGPYCSHLCVPLFVILLPVSSVSAVTDCRLSDLGAIPCKGKEYLSTEFRSALGPTQFPIEWVLASLYAWLKQAELESDNSLPSSAEVTNM